MGGLSILKALREELPHEDFVYLSDSGFAPYGERGQDFVVARARALTTYLTTRQQPPIQALVVACNTATAAAIHVLRQEFPTLPIVGVEPALKSALLISRTRRIGVMATRGTLGSQKFQALRASLASEAEFICQPCEGLAAAIEHDDDDLTRALCASYTQAMGQFGQQAGAIDTLVLGCTHYPFASGILRQLLGPEIHLVSNGAPVARQTRRLLRLPSLDPKPGTLTLLTTGDPGRLRHAVCKWLALDAQVRALQL